jgi:Ca2+-transporting ATPase
MGRSGTEVTKQASDMIITDDNFTSIVAAVEEGRGIYANIRKTLQYLLATNTGELLLMALCLILGLPMPLLPIHLLWINLVTDGLPALSLATGPLERGLLRRPPRPATERMADRSFLFTVALTGMSTGLTSLATYAWALRAGSGDLARTYAFATIVLGQLLCAFSFLSEVQPVWRLKTGTNRRLGLTILGTLSMQIFLFHSTVAAHFFKTSPLSWRACLGLALVSLIPLAVLEIAKMVRVATTGKSQYSIVAVT